MSFAVAEVVRVLFWFWGLLPLCYYIALTVVCGIYRHWISFGFALATAVVLAVWLVLNGAAMISAQLLKGHLRRRAARHPTELSVEDVGTTMAHTGAPTNALNAPAGHRTANMDAEDSPRAFEDSESDTDLTSIRDSVMPSVHANTDNISFSSNVSDAHPVVSGNPLNGRGAGAGRGRRGLVVRAHPTAGTAADRPGSDGDDTCLLSPPEAERQLAETLATAPGQALAPPIPTAPQHVTAAPGKKVSSDSCSVNSGPHGDGGGLAKVVFGVAGADGPRRFSRQSGVAPRCYGAAFMMPVVSLYVSLALALLTLVAAILFEYETHCLLLAFPALCAPCLLFGLIPLLPFFGAYPHAARDFHVRVLHIATHWATLTVTALLGLAVYVVALALESARWTPYAPKDAPVERAVRVVSYLSPVPSFFVILLFVVSNTLHTRTALSQGERKRQRSIQRDHVAAAGPSRFSLRRANTADSRYGPLRAFPGASDAQRDALTTPSSPPQAHGLSLGAARNSVMTHPDLDDNTDSTLSSIVRSSMGSSIFIPPASITALSSRSPSKKQIHDSRHASSASAGLHAVPAAAHVSTLPQLKTVTTLYIAYRNIYNEGEAAAESYSRGTAQGGMAANRTMQQTVSANYEALMEAIEDAREQGSADDNAYVITAYEDALCLVWGLMPFSSEPVLLAIEKARQIMEAFRSRPKPPPTSSNEQQELVAAVVSAPHSLVGFIGTGNYRSIHFFNPRQHEGGSILLQRSMALYRRLPSIQNASDDVEAAFSGILMNSRARNNTASQILARPCGIKYIAPSPSSDAKEGGKRPVALNLAPKLPAEHYPIMYEFLDFVHAKEEEWHLVVQRQERLGAKFAFLTDATQLLQQGDPKGARELLTRTIQNTDSGHDADNIVLAQMTLEDLDRFTVKPS